MMENNNILKDSYNEFWNWFQTEEKNFFNVIKNKEDINTNFFDKLSPKLNEIKEGFYFLAGMYNENTAELVLTVDGNVRNIAFAEELIESAPEMKGWRFTALKPAIDINNLAIEMGAYKFSKDSIYFYSNDYPEYPDEIDLTFFHDDLNKENESDIINGMYIFLDNYLGELDFTVNIDRLSFELKENAEKDLIPASKLKDFLIWRQKEFVEKYKGKRYNTENDNYIGLEAKLENDKPIIAVINENLLKWDSKASHPWVSVVEIKYNGENNNGLPDKETYKLLDDIEDNITKELIDSEGYLNVGRQSADNIREIYFACKDFRKPSKVLFKIKNIYKDSIEIDYDIYKDKYWQTLERFNTNKS